MKFLHALECKNRGRPPVWMMRQAGRCLPEYRKLREKYSIEQLFHTPELAAQVTQMPIDLLGVDAAIIFTDILVIAEAFGFEVRFVEGRGPVITPALNTPQDIDKLQAKEIGSSLSFVFEAIKQVKPELKVPLIGFCGGPFTVASYLIEGGSGGKELAKTKTWLFSHPESFHKLLRKLTDASIEYLKLQIAAGVQAIQIFDSWANVLTTPFFLTFCLHYLKEIVQALKPTGVPIILFCRGSSYFSQELSSIEPSAISFDWHREMNVLRKKVPPHIAVQGNLDPHLLLAPPSVIRAEVQRLMHLMQADPGFIMNLGHGILPSTPFAHAKCFVDTVKDY